MKRHLRKRVFEMTRLPTVAEVDQIAASADAVIRNLRITYCYHQLALALTARTGLAANWCTFATWASRQAGQTIRKQDLERALMNLLRSAEISATAQALGSDRSEAQIQASVVEVLNPFVRASNAVGRGNKKVFEEIGREFARFSALCLNDPIFDAENLARFCDQLRPGDPPDGQQYLRQAFARCYQAFFEADAKTRAELMLLANIEIGYHEQTRLQPEIKEAMDAAFPDYKTFRRQLIGALFPNRGWLVRLRLFLLRLLDRPNPFDTRLESLVEAIQGQARLLITERMMTLALPHDVILRLGSDLPAEFPASLKQIALPDLLALLERIDPTPDSTSGSGAVDWANFDHRLHFIVDLFRCYHESADLFESPFTPEQIAALKEGRLRL
jgi:hypothetical protein